MNEQKPSQVIHMDAACFSRTLNGGEMNNCPISEKLEPVIKLSNQNFLSTAKDVDVTARPKPSVLKTYIFTITVHAL